ncbi:Guanine nucleotide exchange factor lte1 [Marasmius crinis-equi]|uniref:Guanine nucleotide exchange factor lte1 n=1 Tax=Marasmius crinis-equi TaxID=585013 RepID=A0ABR3FF40_9AGAR
MSQVPESPSNSPPLPPQQQLQQQSLPTTPRLLPVPGPSTDNSRISFKWPENEEEGRAIAAGFPAELVSADFLIAPDGTFVETSIGAAAMELKRRYDSHFGVNANVRSPYAITAFVNQHGRRMFRIGHRDLSAPAAAAHTAEDNVMNRASSSSGHPNQSSSLSIPSSSMPSRRQSRLSFLLRSQNSSGGTSKPLYHSSKSKNKLRKPRSNPDLQQQAQLATSPTRPTGLPLHASSTLPMKKSAGGRTHSLSVTAIDRHHGQPSHAAFSVGSFVYTAPVAPSPSTSTTSSSQSGLNTLSPPRHHHSISRSRLSPQAKKGDVFSEVMNWNHSSSGSYHGVGYGRNRDRNNSSASSMSMGVSAGSYTSPTSLSSSLSSSVSSRSSFGGGVGEFGEVTAAGGRSQRSGSNATDNSGVVSFNSNPNSQSQAQSQLITRPFGNNVTFEPRWRPKQRHQRGRQSISNKAPPHPPPVPALPSFGSPESISSSSSSSYGSIGSGKGSGANSPNRGEERRRKSQSWSGAGADPDDDVVAAGKVAREINTGYISDADPAVDGEEEGREEFQLWSAYFDTHITGAPLSSFTTRLNGGNERQPSKSTQIRVPEVHVDGDGVGEQSSHSRPEKGQGLHQGEEAEESDYSRFLRQEDTSSRLRAKPSLDSVMTARQGQGGRRRSSDNLRAARRRKVGKVDEGEEADREDFDDDDDIETPPRPPSAIRMRRPEEDQPKETQIPAIQLHPHTSVSSTPSSDSDGQSVTVSVSNDSDELDHLPKTPTPPAPPSPSTQSHTPQQQSPPTQPLPSTSMHTSFSTDVFDVLQTYRGLPLLDRLEKKRRPKGDASASSTDDETDDDVGEDEEDDGEDDWVIRLSLQDDESAAPRNDPRFVIWGEVNEILDEDDAARSNSNVSQVGAVGSTSRASSISVGGGSESAGGRSRGGSLSKRKAKKEMKKKEKDARSRSGSGTAGVGVDGIPVPGGNHVPTPSSATFSEHTEPTPTAPTHTINPTEQEDGTEKKKQILAATIERWLAQVTSEYNYDELLVFFLTYRTYISPLDLAHLFICRFHWAVSDDPGLVGNGSNGGAGSASGNVGIKRIVRLRTFVALRYWLTTFFVLDFLNNRELRVLMASWLNALVKDPILERYPDALIIVKKLRKLAKEAKRAWVPSSPKRPKASTQEDGSAVTSPSSGSSSLPAADATERPEREHLLGKHFAEVTRALKNRRALEEQDEDSDVDLDFLPDSYATNAGHNINLGSTGIPLASLSILQRTDLAPSPSSPDAESPLEASQTLPMHNNLLSKVMGRLGRWKRVLNNHRSMVRLTAYGGYGGEGFGMPPIGMDLRSTGSRHVWEAQGGLENYSRVARQAIPQGLPPPQLGVLNTAPSISTLRHVEAAPQSTASVSGVETTNITMQSPVSPTASSAATEPSTEEGASSAGSANTLEAPHTPSHDTADTFSLSSRTSSISIARTSSTDSFGVPLSATRSSAMFPAFRSPWQFDVVSIDELSDSSSSEEPNLPPGLAQQAHNQHRPPRRLPTRRVMEVDNEDRGTVSSMGIISRDSHASTNSAASSVSADEIGQGLGRGIHQWQLNDLVDSLTDNEELGDVEDALKRLEGHINPDKLQEKATKVEGWVRTIQQKLQAGDYDEDERPRWMDEEDEDEQGGDGDTSEHVNGSGLSRNSFLSIRETEDDGDMGVDSVKTPVIGPISPPRANSDAKPALEDVVPPEILRSRLPDFPSLVPNRPSISLKSNLSTPHHSFVLDSKADLLAQHFALIDRELFCSLNFDELLACEWMNCEEIEILSWKQFMIDCARWRAESRYPERTSTLGNIRARFNLVVNFTVSEVVHTHPSERLQVFVKLLHVAWRSYHRNSLNTVVAIINGLQSNLVAKAMQRSIARLSSWDARIFRDLKLFIANTNCFRFLREAIDRIMDAKSIDPTSHGSVIVNGTNADQPGRNRGGRGAAPSACIPFIGIYLSQLHLHHQLPDLIDPTAPNEAVGVDPVTSNLDSPAHPEVFDALAPLPPSLHLEPLINVQKQRLIAGVVKSCITGQQLASRIRFPVTDSNVHKACVELNASDFETLQRVLFSLPG